VEIVFKTLYTTYTYFTTFFRETTTRVKSREEVTVVTQFITHDGTDTGDLVDIRRFYVQNGEVIPNSNSSIAGVHGNSITDQFCGEMKQAFGDINDFERKGRGSREGARDGRALPAPGCGCAAPS